MLDKVVAQQVLLLVPQGRCSPQALLQHIIESAEAYGVPLAGENALQR